MAVGEDSLLNSYSVVGRAWASVVHDQPMTNSALHRNQSARSLSFVISAFITLAVSAALMPGNAAAAFRAGDVGFSLKTDAGQTWVYGDSWNRGAFVRNAMTLNDGYVGTVRGVPKGNWVWPGAPFELPNGDIAMYAAEVTQQRNKTGTWSFKVLGGLRAQFDPAHAGQATVTQMPRPSILWSAAAVNDGTNQYVYGIDGSHHAHVAKVNDNGSVSAIRTMGGTISGQFTVLQDPADNKWWMVGQLPFLSRRVVAYPLSGPAGKVTGPALKLITLPIPGASRYTYAATIHPELNGLLTWAVNGSGAGTPYGLQRQAAFWPLSLTYAKAAAAATAARKASASASAGSGGDKVKLWDSKKQPELEDQLDAHARLDTTETWLGSAPDQLEAGMDPNATAPAVWEFGDSTAPPKAPVGEDNDGNTTFVVPATKVGYAAQQAAASSAVIAAKQAAALARAQVDAASNAARLAERRGEALKQAAEAGTRAERIAAERRAEDLKRQAEKAKNDAEKALEQANNAIERAQSALERANGKGRTTWGLAPVSNDAAGFSWGLRG